MAFKQAHKTVRLESAISEAELKKLGGEGWKMCGVIALLDSVGVGGYTCNAGYVYYFTKETTIPVPARNGV